jgi:hypothetical protein
VTASLEGDRRILSSEWFTCVPKREYVCESYISHRDRRNHVSAQATSKFKIEGWDEQPYAETEDGGKLTRASVKQTFDGDISGEARSNG